MEGAGVGDTIGWGRTAPLPVGPAAPLRCGCSSVGRASAFQAEGRGFESRRPLRGRAYALTHLQRDLTVPWTRRSLARVAQLVERILGKDEVRGSIPRASLVVKTERREGRERREGGLFLCFLTTRDS
jgi:hypothetical protein